MLLQLSALYESSQLTENNSVIIKVEKNGI